MALLDLLGRRWTLRVVWELRHEAPSFRALQARCQDVSSSVLSQRLSELREAGIASPGEDGGYALTAEGRALLEALAPIDKWAQRRARRARDIAAMSRGKATSETGDRRQATGDRKPETGRRSR